MADNLCLVDSCILGTSNGAWCIGRTVNFITFVYSTDPCAVHLVGGISKEGSSGGLCSNSGDLGEGSCGD